MNIIFYLASIGLGLLGGFLYARSFPVREEKVHTLLGFFLLPFVRFALFGLALYLLLLSQKIHFIIFMLTFLVTFWFIILKKKA
jgi:hypothetical protein